MIIQNGVGITSLLNGETVKQALNPANETVDRGVYNPTTLSAVDVDLAVGNIADGVTIFGFLGTLVAGVLAEDTTGSDGYGRTASGSGQARHTGAVVDSDADEVIATTTPTFDASSIAVAVGHINTFSSRATAAKGQVLMGGVQVAESAFYDDGITDNHVLIGFRALSGAQTCLFQVHNYHALATTLYMCTYQAGQVVSGAIGVGSIKLA